MRRKENTNTIWEQHIMSTEQSIPSQEWCFGSGKWHAHWEMLTRGCELQQDTKMLLQDWVRLGLNNRWTEYQCSTTQRNTDTQGAKSVSQFQTVTHRWSRWRSAPQSTVTGAVQNSHLSKGLGSPDHRRLSNYFSCTMAFAIQLWKAPVANWHFGYCFILKGYQPGINLCLRVKINEGSK